MKQTQTESLCIIKEKKFFCDKKVQYLRNNSSKSFQNLKSKTYGLSHLVASVLSYGLFIEGYMSKCHSQLTMSSS